MPFRLSTGLCRNRSFSVGKYRFHTNIVVCCIGLCVFFLLMRLSLWQLHRGYQKQAWIKAHQRSHVCELSRCLMRLTQPHLNLSTPNTLHNQTIEWVGHYDANRTILLDNRLYQHRAGVHVLTPFIVPFRGQKKIILVNRGWIPMDSQRRVHTNLTVSNRPTRLRGRLYLVLKKPFLLGKALEKTGNNRVAILEGLDIKPVAQWLNTELLPAIVLLDPAEPDGFVRDWKPTPTLSPSRHFSYAVQWFALACVWLIGFMSVHTEYTNHEKNT